MSSFPTRQIRGALCAKGFLEDQTHHSLHWLVVGGQKRSVRTRLSHGLREYGDELLGRMARQMHLRRRELDEFIECPMTREVYVRLLIDRGVLRI